MRSHLCTKRVGLSLAGLTLGACANSEPEIVDWCSVPTPGDAPAVTLATGGLVYEIYVRSFLDTDGDGIGDLAGVTSKLDYLKLLGVDTIWLMPVFESPSVGGYNTESFRHVNPDYGTDEDLEALFAEAETRGIRVLLDVGLNQTSDTHAWFQAALDDPDGPAGRRYLLSDVRWDEVRWWEAGQDLYYYAFFGPDHPDLNWANPDVATSIRDALNGWLDRGAGGFRLDAVVQLIEEDDAVVNTDGSHCALAWLYGQLKARHPDALLLSEAWSQTVPENLGWLGTEEAPEADMVIDVPMRYALVSALSEGSAAPLLTYTAAQSELTDVDLRRAPYLDAHDLARLPTTLPDARARRSALALLMMSPGAPILFYGDEIGLTDTPEDAEHDEPQRGPMLWDDTYNAGFSAATPWFPVDQTYLDGLNVAAQSNDPTSQWSLVSSLSRLRASSAAAQQGALSWAPSDAEQAMVMARYTDDEGVAVIVNLSSTETVSPTVMLPAELGPWLDLTGGRVGSPALGQVSVESIPPLGYRVLASPSQAGQWIPGPVAAGEE